MDFGRTDIIIVVSMSLAIISMSFVFPALGLTADSDEVAENDIPEFNMSADRFDIAGEFPDQPGTPSQGTLVLNNSVDILEDNRRVWLEGDTDGGTELLLTNQTDDARLVLNHWPGPDKDEVVLSNVGDVDDIQNDTAGWHIKFEYVNIENRNKSNQTITVDYEIIQQPADSAWYSRIPVVGSVFSTGEQLAGIVGWIGSIIYWTFGTMFSVILNLIGILFDVVTYGFSMLIWMVSTYNSIISSASAFASVFVMAPAIILFLEFAKIGMIAINLLPTT